MGYMLVPPLTSEESLDITIPRILFFSTFWFLAFLAYKHWILPSILSYSPYPLSLCAQLAILLDGTGSTDYFFSTILNKTPFMTIPIIYFIAVFFTLIFFLTRLIYFPLLGYELILEGFDANLYTGYSMIL